VSTCALLPVPPGVSAPRTPRLRKKAATGDDAGSAGSDNSGTDDAAAEENSQHEDESGSETEDEAAAAAKAAAKAAKVEKKRKRKKRSKGTSRGGERKEADGTSSTRSHKKSKSSSVPDDAVENGEANPKPPKAPREAGASSSSSGPVGRIRNPADERLLRLKPTQPWTIGAGTWPWALAGNGSMPELYPGLPLWVENVAEFVEALGGGIVTAEELESYKRHIQRSTHFSALLDAYRDSGGLDTKRDNDEHEQLLRSCGWIIRADETELFRLAKDITGRQLLSSSWFELDFDSGVSFPADRQRRCEFCGDESFCACACGTPYCSRLCQRSDWKGHRSYCLSAALHNELGLTCTKMWWSKRGVGMVVERKPDSK